MAMENILVIAVDGLRASALGAYGNTWFETPELDRFAAESFLAEWCFSNVVTLPEVYRGLWFGLHPLHISDAAISLPRQLRQLGYRTLLISDERQLADFGGAADFDEIEIVARDVTDAVEDVADAQTAWLIAAATEALGDHRGPQFMWLHASAMYGPWDAPLEMRQSLADVDDPVTYCEAQSPDTWIDVDDDPDARFRYACAYAAQVQVLDACLGGLLYELNRLDAEAWHVLLVGTRGFPLGEHGRVGGVDERLHAEQLHVPMLVRTADRQAALARSGELVEHADVAATVLEWAGAKSNAVVALLADGCMLQYLMLPQHAAWRDRSVAAHDSGARAIRTAHWCWQRLTADGLEESGELEASREHLYVRPDDRWEANDVSTLCPQIADSLAAAVADFEAHCRHKGAPQLAPLDPALLEPIR